MGFFFKKHNYRFLLPTQSKRAAFSYLFILFRKFAIALVLDFVVQLKMCTKRNTEYNKGKTA